MDDDEIGMDDMKQFGNAADSIYTELWEVLVSKQKDYGPYNISRAPGGAENGVLVRMNDKMERLKNLVYGGGEPLNEAIEDSLLDIANYAVICLMVRRGQWPA